MTPPLRGRVHRPHGSAPLGPLAGIKASTSAPFTPRRSPPCCSATWCRRDQGRAPQGRPRPHPRLEPRGARVLWKVIARNSARHDLTSAARGAELLRKLVVDADVLVENFDPASMEKWGLGRTCCGPQPRLVMLRVTGFGQTGPYAQRRAFGTLMEAMSGFAHQTGGRGPPTLPPFGLADGVAGITGALAVLTPVQAGRSEPGDGAGQVIDLRCWSRCRHPRPGPTVYDQLGSSPDGTATARRTTPRATPTSPARRWVAISASATSIAERVRRWWGGRPCREAVVSRRGAQPARRGPRRRGGEMSPRGTSRTS